MGFLYILWCNFRELAREGLQSKPRVLSPTSGGFTALVDQICMQTRLNVHINGATIWNPNTKVLEFQGLFVFLGHLLSLFFSTLSELNGLKSTKISFIYIFLEKTIDSPIRGGCIIDATEVI